MCIDIKYAALIMGIDSNLIPDRLIAHIRSESFKFIRAVSDNEFML